MKAFSTLIATLDTTNKTTLKLEAIDRFLSEAEERDKLWFLALFTGKRPRRNVSTALLRQWAMEITGIPEWLFRESYTAVGDLGETISLILPEPLAYSERSLSEWMELIAGLSNKTEEEKKDFVIHAWQHLPHAERFIFNKLLGGSFRAGISAQSLINALAAHYSIDASTVAHSVMGHWAIDEVSFDDLIKGGYTDVQSSRPYPFCLAYPLDRTAAALGDISEWQAEYKWDGIRGQVIKRNGQVYIWSRGEELVTEQFPEIRDAILQWNGDFVLDGELLAFKDDRVLNFSDLQKRLNRKNPAKKIIQEIPVMLYAYDVLEWENEDCRHRGLAERRALLEQLYRENACPEVRLSPVIECPDWETLANMQQQAREVNSEGLMLKHKASPYHTGRKRGDWWKWKTAPMTIDAVLIYAQKGSGRRSGHYTDYTFAVKQGDELVTIAKAYSGLTDQEIKEVSSFVNKNAVEKFGPVRTVRPELVFEIAFEGIGFSNRHKSGVALRFPRIVRWRRDKTVRDIDDIEEIKKMIR